MNFRVALGAFLGGLVICCASALAQAPAAPTKPATKSAAPSKAVTASPTRPSWNELTPAQREALAPLAGMWPTIETDRKRMTEFAKLTPEQRQTLRENFRRAYELPADQRQEKLQKYQELPEDAKRELAKQASKKKQEPPRRPTRDLQLDPVQAPPGTPSR